MDYQERLPIAIDGEMQDDLDRAADAVADAITGSLSDSVSEALADPMIVAMMKADGVDPKALETMLRAKSAAAGQEGRCWRPAQPAVPQLKRCG